MIKNCNNCRFYGQNGKFDTLCKTCGFLFSSHWAPMTDAQKLEQEMMRIPTGLSGSMETGYTYDSTKRKEYNKMYKSKSSRQKALERIKKVIFNDPCTIVLWNDGTKTVVKCGEDDVFDPEKGLAMAISKYFFDNAGYYNDVFKKWIPKKEKTDEKPIIVLHSVKELAELLGCSVDIIRKNIKKGEYPGARKEHGQWIIPYKF